MRSWMLAVLAAGVCSSPADAVRPLSAAILDFKESSEDLSGTGASVSALLQAKLGEDSTSPLVERAEIKEILDEQELGLSGLAGKDQVVRAGQLTGAEVLVSGRVFAVQNRVYVAAKVISSSTGRVFGATADFERRGTMDAAIASLSKQIATTLTEKRGDLAEAKPLEDRQLDLLKTILKDRKPLKAYISIVESVVPARASESVAQTELRRTLQAAGWTMVGAEADADLSVTGTALAETAVRRGKLWFARARLDFTIKTAEGKVLKTDRMVAGSVDLAEADGTASSLRKAGLLTATEVAKTWTSTLNKH